KLRILDVEHLNERMINIDVLQVIELLKHKVARVVKDIAARMIVGRFEETLKRHAIVQVFTGVNFITQIHSCLIKSVKNGKPALGEFLETIIDKSGSTLGPGIDRMPDQRAGERGVSRQAEVLTGARGEFALINCPGGTILGFTMDALRGKGIKEVVIRGVHGYELPLKVS